MSALLHELIAYSAARDSGAEALRYGTQSLSYADLAQASQDSANRLLQQQLGRSERVAIYLEKRIETVTAIFGAALAGGVFVPVNPLLKGEQVSYILRDCNVRILVTSRSRYELIQPELAACSDLRSVFIVDDVDGLDNRSNHYVLLDWKSEQEAHGPHRVIDTDMAAILYTSGSTGKPKGVVLSHRNMVAGAKSVAQYLENRPGDRLLAVLPLSFDAGFSQLTTAFHSGGCAVLLNHLLPRDVINALVKEKITGLTAVPPLWIQLTQLEWPATITEHLRYIANTGGRMPKATLDALRTRLPKTKPFLMYGLTEAFRATYLDPSEVDHRPDSIGKSIPNSEVLVLREDGTPCAPNEPGELVQRGALVGMGYWNDPEKTAERYKPLPNAVRAAGSGLVMPEIAVFSGDNVRMDDEGFLYFIGRRDEMIKTSGYRVSPTEIEEVAYATGLVNECAAFGIEHPEMGQAIVLIATPKADALDANQLRNIFRTRCPAYQVPTHIDIRTSALPRNPNGKIDRKLLSSSYQTPEGKPA